MTSRFAQKYTQFVFIPAQFILSKPGKVMRSEARQVCYKAIAFCDSEKESGVTIPISNATKRAAALS